jgi:hypothetical protein
MVAAYVLELVLERHPFAALIVALLSITGLWRTHASPWLCLRVEPDGQLLLIAEGARSVQVSPGPGGLRLGRYLLLVVRSETGSHRMLLGPDNVAAGELAALKRRLPD